MSLESASYDIKTLREDRHAAEENSVAEATRRRRRISRASFFFYHLQQENLGRLSKKREFRIIHIWKQKNNPVNKWIIFGNKRIILGEMGENAQ